MTTLREAAMMALEALENGKRVRAGEGGTKFQIPLEDNAMTALRAALAQQEEPCPNCASLEAQNTELDQKLAELEQAYQSGYNAGVAHERKRIIQFLTEMQRQVGDGHNYYGVAAMRIRERV